LKNYYIEQGYHLDNPIEIAEHDQMMIDQEREEQIKRTN
jgi:hypothetical protein